MTRNELVAKLAEVPGNAKIEIENAFSNESDEAIDIEFFCFNQKDNWWEACEPKVAHLVVIIA